MPKNKNGNGSTKKEQTVQTQQQQPQQEIVEQTAPDQQNSNPPPPPPPPPTQPPTQPDFTELLAMAAKMAEDAKNAANVNPEEAVKKLIESINAQKKIVEDFNAKKIEEKKAVNEKLKGEHVGKLNEMLTAYDNYVSVKNSMPIGTEKTPEQNAQLDAAYNSYIDKKLWVETELGKTFTMPKSASNEVLNIPMGQTGSTLTKRKGTGEDIKNRYIQLRSEGLSTTDATKKIIAEGFSRGTTGAVILAYRRSIGETE